MGKKLREQAVRTTSPSCAYSELTEGKEALSCFRDIYITSPPPSAPSELCPALGTQVFALIGIFVSSYRLGLRNQSEQVTFLWSQQVLKWELKPRFKLTTKSLLLTSPLDSSLFLFVSPATLLW